MIIFYVVDKNLPFLLFLIFPTRNGWNLKNAERKGRLKFKTSKSYSFNFNHQTKISTNAQEFIRMLAKEKSMLECLHFLLIYSSNRCLILCASLEFRIPLYWQEFSSLKNVYFDVLPKVNSRAAIIFPSKSEKQGRPEVEFFGPGV